MSSDGKRGYSPEYDDERRAVSGYQILDFEAADGQSGEPDHCSEASQWEAVVVLPLRVRLVPLLERR
jgi:hypothetical protein